MSCLAGAEMLEEEMLCLRNCAWSSTDLSSFATYFTSDDFSHRAVAELRRQALEPPVAPGLPLQSALANTSPLLPEKPPPPPGWLKSVCNLRDKFAGTIFSLLVGDIAWYGLFLYAKESPYRAFFRSLVVLDEVGDVTSSAPSDLICGRIPWAFDSQGSDGVTDLKMPAVDEDDVFVLLHVATLQRPSHRYVSWADFVHLSAILEEEPPKDRAQKVVKRQSRAAASTAKDLVASMPWLSIYLGNDDVVVSSSSHSSSTARNVADRVTVVEAELPDDEVDEIFRRLEVKRSACRAMGPTTVEHFGCSILGGRWTKINLGVTADACKAHAIGKDVATFCASKGLPKSLTLTFSKYTERAASALGHLWCEVTECIYSALQTDDMLPDDVEDLMAALPAVTRCASDLDGLSPQHVARAKMQEILDIRPTA